MLTMPMQPLTQSGINRNRMGSEAGYPLRAHAFRDSEREGVMDTPSASLYNSLNYTLTYFIKKIL